MIDRYPIKASGGDVFDGLDIAVFVRSYGHGF
jgi:hypothetical protein